MTRREILECISKASDRYGNHLVEMMDYYNVYSLPDLTDEQVRDYWQSHANKIERSQDDEQRIDGRDDHRGGNHPTARD